MYECRTYKEYQLMYENRDNETDKIEKKKIIEKIKKYINYLKLLMNKINEIIARFMSDKQLNATNETGNSITEYNNFRDADNSSENITYLSCEKNKDVSICCTKVNNAKVNDNDPILFL